MADQTPDDVEVEDAAVEKLDWQGEVAEFSDAMLARARAYGSYVIQDRAIPDIRDGLKPSQRRIIVTMDDIGARAGTKYQKSAKTTGNVIANYHPHGNAAVYDAMVRMAQDFVMVAPLIDGQGNWGSVGGKEHGDPAAAERYTEARLSAIATDALADLNKDIVRYQKNYDETKIEPTVLPITFPNLIVNGAKGIAWGMACEIPPHNLAESIDAAIYLIDNPDATIKQLMKRLPAPDFPSGGIIINPEVLEACYTTGRGSVRQRCKFTVENLPGNRQAMVITELPYMVSPSKIVKQVVAAAMAEEITEVAPSDPPADLSDKKGIKVQITLSRQGNMQALIDQVLKHTDCEISVPFNLNVLISRKPKVVSLKEILQHFIDFRVVVVTKRLELERANLIRDLRRLKVQLAALDVIDKVVKIIRESKDDDDSREKLIKLLKWTPYGEKKAVPIDEEQAQYILDMPLKRLNQLNRFKLEEEVKTKETRVAEIDKTLSTPGGVQEIVKEELRETKKKYGQPRKTHLGNGEVLTAVGDDGVISGGPAEPVRVYVADNGYVYVGERPKKQPAAAPLKLASDSDLIAVFDTMSDSAVYAFTEQGTCYRLNLANCPVESGKSKGRQFVPVSKGDHVIAVFPVGSAPFYTMVTENGEIKRIPEDTIVKGHAGGVPAMGVAQDDKIISVVAHEEADDIIISSGQGKAIRIPLAKISPKKGGAAGGMAGMKLVGDDYVIYACLARGNEFLVVHETAMGKRVKLSEYPQKGRGGGGVASAAIDKPTRGTGPAGPVVVGIAYDSKAETLLFTAAGQIVTIDPKKVAEGTRAAVSKPAFDLGPGDQIVGIVSESDES